MTQKRFDRFVEKLREKLVGNDNVPDDATGQLIINLQTGGISGKISYQVDVESPASNN